MFWLPYDDFIVVLEVLGTVCTRTMREFTRWRKVIPKDEKLVSKIKNCFVQTAVKKKVKKKIGSGSFLDQVRQCETQQHDCWDF